MKNFCLQPSHKTTKLMRKREKKQTPIIINFLKKDLKNKQEKEKN